MKTSVARFILMGLSLSLLLAALLLAGWQWNAYRLQAPVFPPGTQIAGIPVGGLDRQGAAERLQSVYNQPVTLTYEQAEIQVAPAQLGFSLDLEGMLAEAGLPGKSWRGFWGFLMGLKQGAADIPLRFRIDREHLRAYLKEEIASRYDQAALPPLPYPGTVDFQPGVAGIRLDIERAIPLVESALRSRSRRVAALPLETISPPAPPFQHLETLLRQTIQLSGFDGVTGLYLQDLESGQEINFALQEGLPLPVPPEVAFSGASIIKIPIMISVFKRLESAPDPETERLLREMIEESGNETADWLMERIIDPERAPLMVTEDMQALGLENTFLAGYFHPGAPVLALYETPANRRADTLVDPDVYNQTTPAEIGRLLASLYRCSLPGSGGAQGDSTAISSSSQGATSPAGLSLPAEITQEECERMLAYLAGNKTPYLIESGLPEEVEVIHKHGWVSLFEVINTIGDAALVSTPAADYVLVVYLYDPDLLLWDPASALIARLSEAAYNYFMAREAIVEKSE